MDPKNFRKCEDPVIYEHLVKFKCTPTDMLELHLRLQNEMLFRRLYGNDLLEQMRKPPSSTIQEDDKGTPGNAAATLDKRDSTKTSDPGANRSLAPAMVKSEETETADSSSRSEATFKVVEQHVAEEASEGAAVKMPSSTIRTRRRSST
ncbi:hypothetical protein ACLMJK_008843 [Lecanora helva]